MKQNNQNNSSRWDKEKLLREILSNVLTENEVPASKVEEFLKLYRDFRRADIGSHYYIPSTPIDSDKWLKDLFGENRHPLMVCLDNIGRDFLLFVSCSVRVEELLFGERDFSEMVGYLLNSPEVEALNNSLIRIEALSNVLRNEGFKLDETGKEENSFILLTNPPKKKGTDTNKGTDNPLRMVRDMDRFSKYVRSLSVCLQERGQYPHILTITPDRFNLPNMFVRYDETQRGDTARQAQRMAIDREFQLWDIDRNRKFPSLEAIEAETGIPYILLLMIRYTSESGEAYQGDNLLNDISERWMMRFSLEIKKQAKEIIKQISINIATIE